ncbi:otoferlin-like [Uloborus diversus]|uniref:otoferlin-like n=1 Tax=Uloborus diversus TaxID=327109 RepID=UPI00240944EF|nr:otoferlin-like [Uloborus diversus]
MALAGDLYGDNVEIVTRSKMNQGTFEGCFRIYREPLPPDAIDKSIPFNCAQDGFFSIIPENNPIKALIRAYIVKAVNLTPADTSNTCDAYIVMRLGKQKFNDKEHYVSKQLNPVFGKCFEFVANFPSDSILHVQVFDWDLVGSDDFIGETTIDLENRFYSKHRATCGLPRSYETDGPNAWRDALTPTEILSNLCLENGMDGPHISNKEICIDDVIYDFDEDLNDEKASEEHMALCILNKWQEVCPQKYPLVPEHVEIRTLYHPSKPGESQGQLYMWLDIFPEDTVPPNVPRDIAIRKPIGYELRVIIWNTDDVTLADDAFFTGEKMSDIYVKGWLTGKSDEQTTDVHYRSLTGEGNFNWRFVFPFNYLPLERHITIMKKVSLFSWDDTEFKIPPVLNLEVWDADQFSKDDYLGELRLNLNNFPRGAKTSRLCDVKMLETDGSVPHMSLFKQKRTKGWWPFFTRKNGKMELSGKVEMELQLLPSAEASKAPVGKGRKGPEALEMPERPITSFHNFLHPLKTFRYAFWRNYKWKILRVLFIIACALLIALFVYSVPGYSVKKLLGA